MRSRGPGACHEISARVSASSTNRATTLLVVLALGCGSVTARDEGAGCDAGAVEL
jgi:hypothetical protein